MLNSDIAEVIADWTIVSKSAPTNQVKHAAVICLHNDLGCFDQLFFLMY